jgi:hypothetical protein
MTVQTFDRLTRRASLLTFGMAGMARLTGSLAADAKRHHKKRKKRKKGDATKLCKLQVDQCIEDATINCQTLPEERIPQCLAAVDLCCPILGTCDFDGFFLCTQTAVSARSLITPRLIR